MTKPPAWNPHHPVTEKLEDQWHKIVALLMLRDGVRKTVIPAEFIEQMANDPLGMNIAIRIDDTIGITLEIVSDADGRKMAEREGGI